eukprot:scaffold8100_cov66-Cyclotella_meneghiniana.AAC.5
MVLYNNAMKLIDTLDFLNDDNRVEEENANSGQTEFNHKHYAFIIYRIYFRGVTEDPNIFTPSAVSDNSNPNQNPDSCRVDENPSAHFNESIVVSSELVHAALAAINVALCQPRGANEDDENPGILNLQKYHDGLGTSEAIMNLLYKSPVWTVAQRLLGRDNIMDVNRGQIALRPPNLDLMNKKKEGLLPPIRSWHIDGESISLLVGITLSDALEPYSGNLCVYPGSHRKTLPWVKKQKDTEIMIQKPDLADGKPILAKAGDVVLAHQKTAHKGMGNASHEIRYQ